MLGLARRLDRTGVAEATAPRTFRVRRPAAASELSLRSACETVISSKVVDRVSLWLPGLRAGYITRTAGEYGLEVKITERIAGCTAFLSRSKEEGES